MGSCIYGLGALGARRPGTVSEVNVGAGQVHALVRLHAAGSSDTCSVSGQVVLLLDSFFGEEVSVYSISCIVQCVSTVCGSSRLSL